MSLRSLLLDLFFPPKCPICGQPGPADTPCPRCRQADFWLPPEQAVFPGRDFRCCVCAGWYRDDLRASLLRYKFSGRRGYAKVYGPLLAEAIRPHLTGHYDLISWVPVSRQTLKKRGYDQAQLLAQAAGRVWGVRPERLLEKVRDNPAQSGLEGAEARQENVRNVYQALPAAAGKRILLIDDICTTGATLSECARVLTQAGAAGVVCAAAARTPREKVHSSVKE